MSAVADSRTPAALPLVPTVLCLFGAGWLGGVASLLVAGALDPVTGRPLGWAVMMVALQAVSATVGSFVVRYLLRTIVGCDVTLGGALAALLAGALVTAFAEALLARGSSAATALPAHTAVSVGGALVSYFVLQQVAWSRSEAPVPSRRAETASFESAGYGERVGAVRETFAGLVDDAIGADVAHVAEVILDGLPTVDAAGAALRGAVPPANVPGELHQRLVGAAASVHAELVSAARSAALGDDPRLQLAGSKGMSEMRHALRALAERGVANEW